MQWLMQVISVLRSGMSFFCGTSTRSGRINRVELERIPKVLRTISCLMSHRWPSADAMCSVSTATIMTHLMGQVNISF